MTFTSSDALAATELLLCDVAWGEPRQLAALAIWAEVGDPAGLDAEHITTESLRFASRELLDLVARFRDDPRAVTAAALCAVLDGGPLPEDLGALRILASRNGVAATPAHLAALAATGDLAVGEALRHHRGAARTVGAAMCALHADEAARHGTRAIRSRYRSPGDRSARAALADLLNSADAYRLQLVAELAADPDTLTAILADRPILDAALAECVARGFGLDEPHVETVTGCLDATITSHLADALAQQRSEALAGLHEEFAAWVLRRCPECVPLTSDDLPDTPDGWRNWNELHRQVHLLATALELTDGDGMLVRRLNDADARSVLGNLVAHYRVPDDGDELRVVCAFARYGNAGTLDALWGTMERELADASGGRCRLPARRGGAITSGPFASAFSWALVGNPELTNDQLAALAAVHIDGAAGVLANRTSSPERVGFEDNDDALRAYNTPGGPHTAAAAYLLGDPDLESYLAHKLRSERATATLETVVLVAEHLAAEYQGSTELTDALLEMPAATYLRSTPVNGYKMWAAPISRVVAAKLGGDPRRRLAFVHLARTAPAGTSVRDCVDAALARTAEQP